MMMMLLLRLLLLLMMMPRAVAPPVIESYTHANFRQPLLRNFDAIAVVIN